MNPEITLNGKKIEVKVVDEADAESESVLTLEEIEMDRAMRQAVSDAIKRAKRLGLPIAAYDEEKKKAYTDYADGRRVYVDED